jgi:hypothetical protein
MPDGPVLDRALVDSLFPADLPDPQHWEQRYPPHALPEGAQVTRFGPSPIGSVHTWLAEAYRHLTVAREANVILNSRCPA